MTDHALTAGVADFIAATARLDTDGWTTVFATKRASYDAGYLDAQKALAPSASQRSAIERAVLDALRDRIGVITPADRNAFTQATTSTNSAAAALLTRSSLGDAEADLLLAPFIAAGIDVGAADRPGERGEGA